MYSKSVYTVVAFRYCFALNMQAVYFWDYLVEEVFNLA